MVSEHTIRYKPIPSKQDVHNSDTFDRHQGPGQRNSLSRAFTLGSCDDPAEMSVAQLYAYFARTHLSEAEILSHPLWYMNDSYLFIAKTLPQYAAYVKKYYELYRDYTMWQKLWGCVTGTYTGELASRFMQLHVCEEARQRDICRTALKNSRSIRSSSTSRQVLLQFDEQVSTFARKYGITEHMLCDNGTMDAHAYQLASEFMEQLTIAARVSAQCPCDSEYALFFDALGYGIAIGIEENNNKHAAAATYWADYGWQVLDIIKSIGEGFGVGLHNAAEFGSQVLLHPVDTAKTVICGIATITRFLARTTGMIFEASVGDEQAYANLSELGGQITSIMNHCAHDLSVMPVRDIVKRVTACATEIIVTGKVIQMAHLLCAQMKPVLMSALKTLQKEQKVSSLITAGGHSVIEGASIAEEMVVIEQGTAIAKTGAAATEVAYDALASLKTFHAQFMRNLEPEVALLRQLFDNTVKGFNECANKYLKIDYEHIFGMELLPNRKGLLRVGGFHYDPMNVVENSGIIKFANKIMENVNGVYKADLIVNGLSSPGKTFFPAHWSREQVVRAIYEAYENRMQTGILPDIVPGGKYKIVGFCNSGIEIEMFITPNGKITTAYPKL